jgi:hypothetical protein
VFSTTPYKLLILTIIDRDVNMTLTFVNKLILLDNSMFSTYGTKKMVRNGAIFKPDFDTGKKVHFHSCFFSKIHRLKYTYYGYNFHI